MELKFVDEQGNGVIFPVYSLQKVYFVTPKQKISTDNLIEKFA